MIGNILGAMECFGLVFLSAHYFHLEYLTRNQLILCWFLVIFPIIMAILLCSFDKNKLKGIKR